MRILILAATPATLAAGCSDGGADADRDGAITAEEAAAEASGGGMAMRPGEWEQTISFSEFDAPGLPPQAREIMQSQMGGSFTSTTCLTAADVSGERPGFFNPPQNEDCTYDEFDRSGNSMTIRMTCNAQGGGTARTALDGRTEADSYELTIATEMSGGPTGGISMSGTVTGRRLGDCPTG